MKCRVEQLMAAIRTGHPLEADIAGWVAALTPSMANKLARVGLVPKPTVQAAVELGTFLKTYMDSRNDLKPATKIVQGQVIRDLKEFFGESRDVKRILPGDADDFKQSLIGRKLAPTTVHKRLQVARSFFHAMLRRKLIHENPFEGVKAAATGHKERQQFVTREEIARVLDACPDHHWRTIVALARYGGLRTPSETLSVRWQDIDGEAGRIVVTSPKTEHHAGKASRTIPLFAELRPILNEAFDLAEDGAEYVIDAKYRKAAMGPGGWMNANLRTTFEKIVRRAGLTPWPRLFHNLRASRETELVELFPIQTVTGWLGNTPSVAMRHYLMTTDQHFEAAVRGDSKAVQKPLETSRNQFYRKTQKPRYCRGLRRIAIPCEIAKWRGQDSNLRPRGYEPRELPGCSTPRCVLPEGRERNYSENGANVQRQIVKMRIHHRVALALVVTVSAGHHPARADSPQKSLRLSSWLTHTLPVCK